MNLSLIPFVTSWVVLACVVAGLAIYRRMISGQEDEMIHVADSERVHIGHQAAMAQRLEVIDRWGKILTVVVLLYGLAVAALYFYQVWMAGFNQV